jgi:1-deoxy-D-xylulose-5-phosphate synthase
MSKPHLSTISSPEDLKHLSLDELGILADEIRRQIIDVLALNGGHLASNLGIVELTIALHKVFSSPNDKFIFDVSHQCYTHKLLTGRHNKFHTVRQFDGISGFSNPKESPHDHFFSGHAGTALSLGLGLAKNRDLSKRSEHIIPIFGDAALSCGLTLEALNNIPKELKNFIVVLNDNKMSISNNVGAISRLLSRLVNHPKSNKIYKEIESLLLKIPSCGTTLAKQGHKLRESLKNLVSIAPFFEQFGLTYVGPVDGHDLKAMIDLFEALKNCQEPTFIHVLTEKGRGMKAASLDPTTYHGVKPFDKVTGQINASPSSTRTFPKIFGNHIVKMAENDPSLVAITPAMASGSCLESFMQRFPHRCIDVGIAEGHAVTFSGALAYGKKMKVVCSIYSTFLQRALDNLFHDVCLQEVPVVFAIDRAGISGPDGSTHHGIYDIPFLNAMPNMVICQPRDGHLLKELLESAFSWSRPTAIRYPNQKTPETQLPLRQRELGQGEVLAAGNTIAILALGHMCETALKVKELLLEQGYDATVIDPIFVKPLDTDLLFQIASTHPFLVTLEEHALSGGFGAIINSFLMRNHCQNVSVLNFGIPDTFVEQGTNQELMQELGLNPESITKEILNKFDLVLTPALH